MDPDDAKAEVLKALLPKFLRRRGEDVKRIVDAAAAGDFDVIATLGHNLRGNGTSYGFPQLSALGESLEQHARARDRDAVLRDAERLTEEVARIEAAK